MSMPMGKVKVTVEMDDGRKVGVVTGYPGEFLGGLGCEHEDEDSWCTNQLRSELRAAEDMAYALRKVDDGSYIYGEVYPSKNEAAFADVSFERLPTEDPDGEEMYDVGLRGYTLQHASISRRDDTHWELDGLAQVGGDEVMEGCLEYVLTSVARTLLTQTSICVTP